MASAAEDTYPAVSSLSGAWAKVSTIETGQAAGYMFADANGLARIRQGDIVRGREAIVYEAPQTDGANIFQAKIQEGDFDCRNKTVRWRRLAEIDLSKRSIHINATAQTEFSALTATSADLKSLEFLCGSADIHNRSSYFNIEDARKALLVEHSPQGGDVALIESPAARWNAPEPASQSVWRAIDEQISNSQLLDTANVEAKGQKVRAWVAVVDTLHPDLPVNAPAITEVHVEIDCSTSAVFIMTIRETGASNQTLEVTSRNRPGEPANFGLFEKADGRLGIKSACHPSRLADSKAFDTLTSYRAERMARR